jgi:hypothetical protein
MENPTRYRITASRRVAAPASRVYDIIADYRDGHPSILPRAFRNLQVDEGGRGAGTRFHMDVHAFGRKETMRAAVTEPQPGRVLVEKDLDRPTVTTFTVERGAHEGEAFVTFDTELESRSGVLGAVERWVSTAFLQRVYREELGNLDRVAGGGHGDH